MKDIQFIPTRLLVTLVAILSIPALLMDPFAIFILQTQMRSIRIMAH